MMSFTLGAIKFAVTLRAIISGSCATNIIRTVKPTASTAAVPFGGNGWCYRWCWNPFRNPDNREFKIRRLRTTTTVKHATAHDQNHVTVHFSCVVLRLRWVVKLFRVVGTTENILLVFCRLGNSRISSFRKKSFQFTCLKWEGISKLTTNEI